MPKHERSEYMKGALFAEEQKEIGNLAITKNRVQNGNGILMKAVHAIVIRTMVRAV